MDEYINAKLLGLYKDQVQVDKDKYYHLGICPEEIQISENEMASDSDRHRSLNRHRRGTVERKILDSAPEHNWSARIPNPYQVYFLTRRSCGDDLNEQTARSYP